MGNPAPLAKLSIPRLANGIARRRLFDLLDTARRKPGIWITAPGGAGKTTLAATYLAERQLPYIWYQLDRDDADPATFFYYLGIAARHATSDQALSLPLLTPEYLPDVPGFARRYFRELFALLPPGTLVVLDNYEDLGDNGLFDSIMHSTVSEIPEGGNLLVNSRSSPPPQFARHQVAGMLEVLSWETMRLTLEETASIAAGVGDLDQASVEALHERCEGWAAGLTLLLGQVGARGPAGGAPGRRALETVFDYFASEYFDHLPPDTRDFLLKTALLPRMTAAMAEEVSGNSHAAEILADFHRRHFFINRLELAELTYQYHALFREFLQARAMQMYSLPQYLALAKASAEALDFYGWEADAVSLYLHARDWRTAVPLILRQAPQLLAQGRGQTLAGWIRQLPEEKVEADPWLLYWQGMGGQFLEPDKARTGLERAYAGFEAGKNTTGQLLAASGIIDIVYVMRASLLSAAPWLEVLQAHLETEPRFPSPAMEARVLSSLLSMLELMRPGDPRLCHYAERLATLLEADLDVNEKMVMAGRLAIYHAVINGDAEACERILLQARSLQDSPGLTVASGFVWRISSVLPYLFADCRTAAAQEPVDWLLGMVRDGTLRAMLDDNNLSPLEFIMSYYAVLVHLHSGNVDAAGPLLERMAALVPSSQSIDMAILMMVKCLHARAGGDLPLAQKCGQDSLGAHGAVGATISRLEVCCIMAIICCERGEPGEAFEYLASPKESGVGDSPRMRFHVPLIESYAYLMQQQTELCHARLREALAEGSARRYWGNGFWVERILPRLCSEALRADIEVDYVRQLICKRGLAPEDADDEYWHWPVRVYTLGRFRLVINDQPFDVHTRGQSKPLHLLQVLVALGGTGVRREQLAEVLWPDAEADAALFTLTTTLARLRKIIGQTAVRVKNGRLSLNEKLCWVDARAVEYHLGDADRNDGGGAGTGGCGLLDRVMTLYQGPFLNDEDGGWVEPMRERMRSKFARFVARCCRSMDEAGEADRASGVRRRALEIDPGCRAFLQDVQSSDALGQ